MPKFLPAEIVNAIASTVAEQEVYTDRSWVVQLALVGHEVFRAVRPILYADLVITNENKEKFPSALALKDHLLPYVRRITATEDSALLDSILQEWQPQPGCYIQVPWRNLERLLVRLSAQDSDVAKGQLTGLDLAYTSFTDTCLHRSAGIPATIATHLTYVSGVMPNTWDVPDQLGFASQTAVASPRSWAAAILDAFPHLTHLGLAIPDQPEQWDEENHHWIIRSRPNYPTQVDEAIQELLELRDTLFVFLRVVGQNDFNEGHLRKNISSPLYLNPRFTFWIDERSVWGDYMVEELVVEDAWSGRNIWSGPPNNGFV